MMYSSCGEQKSKIKIIVKKNEMKHVVKYVDLCCGIGGFRKSSK